MPLYDYQCEKRHVDERYFHLAAQAPEVAPCRICGERATKLLSLGKGICYFEEGRGHWIENLGHQPVYVTSHEQHKAEMKKHGVTWATKGQGMKGCWI